MKQDRNRRKFRRQKVSIPCTVQWQDQIVSGQIEDLSFGGALVTQVSAAIPEYVLVTLIMQYKDRGIHLEGRVNSEVIHVTEANAFGIQFETSLDELWSKLSPVIRDLAPDENVFLREIPTSLVSQESSPKKGMAVSIEGTSKGIAAKVLTASREQLGLELVRPAPVPFQVGDEVKVIYWDNEPVVCRWAGKISNVGGPQNRHLILSILDQKIEHRKFARFKAAIPFTFTVIDAADATLNGKSVVGETQDISVGGLLFDTFHPLTVGDKLSLTFQLPESQPADTLGWVVRSTQVQRTPYIEGMAFKAVNSAAVEFLQWQRDSQVQLLRLLLQVPMTE